jgi:hypothetical protein
MREAGWDGLGARAVARGRICTLSFALVFIFSFSMIFCHADQHGRGTSSTQEGRRVWHDAGRPHRTGDRAASAKAVFLLGFWGAAFSSVMGVYHGVAVPVRRHAALVRADAAARTARDRDTVPGAVSCGRRHSAQLFGRPLRLVFADTSWDRCSFRSSCRRCCISTTRAASFATPATA